MNPNISVPSVQLPVMLVAEVQDSLLVAMHDLHRLEGLIAHATDNLMDRFATANVGLARNEHTLPPELVEVRHALHGAVTELQFQDMASQLLTHTARVLQGCANRLGVEVMGYEDGEEPPVEEPSFERPNPVTQSEMHAGSVDLF